MVLQFYYSFQYRNAFFIIFLLIKQIAWCQFVAYSVYRDELITAAGGVIASSDYFSC